MLRKIIALFVLVCLVPLVPACTGEERPGPESVLAQFIQLWDKGSWAEMYTLLSEQAQAGCDEKTFCTRYGNISSGIGLEHLKLVQVSLEGNQLQYTLEFQTSTVEDFQLSYIMETAALGEEWKLHWDHCHIFPDLTAQRVVRVSRQMPRRGSILDRNNTALASMDTAYSVGLVPGDMSAGTVGTLALLLDMSVSEVDKLLGQSWVTDNTYVPIQTISAKKWSQLREALSSLQGVSVRETTSRVYNIPESMSQTIGYVDEVEPERLSELEALGFMAGDIVGQAGIELICDSILAGRPGFTITIREGNETVSLLAEREPVQGMDVVTTLDLDKNRLLDTVLAERAGSMLLMDFFTGDILGVVSKPGYDSNLFALGMTPRQYEEMLELDSPFFNRAFNGLYPPGSIFKPFTALMALQQQVFDPEYSWDTPRQWQKSPDWGAYQVTRVARPLGPVDLWDAMKWSDNVYFADLGLKVGWEDFISSCQALGFNSVVPFALNYKQSQIRNIGSGEVLLADSSYGQGEMLVTPLHITLMYTAIARQDGAMPIPRLLETDPAGIWLETGLGLDNLELVDRILAYAASDQDALAWVGQETVRGKTGTSEISSDRQIAWYICYFDNMILAVTLEGDRSLSSLHAVALARECLDQGIRDK